MKRIAAAVLATVAFYAPVSASAGYVWDPQSDTASDAPLSPYAEDVTQALMEQQNAADSMQTMRDKQRAESEAAGRARNAEAAAERAREEANRNSPVGHIQGAEQQIRYCTARIAQARDALKREKEIEQESGVQNLSLRYEAGSAIAYCKGQVDVAFREYRQYGGTAPSSAALVKKLVADRPVTKMRITEEAPPCRPADRCAYGSRD